MQVRCCSSTPASPWARCRSACGCRSPTCRRGPAAPSCAAGGDVPSLTSDARSWMNWTRSNSAILTDNFIDIGAVQGGIVRDAVDGLVGSDAPQHPAFEYIGTTASRRRLTRLDIEDQGKPGDGVRDGDHIQRGSRDCVTDCRRPAACGVALRLPCSDAQT